MPLTGIFKMKTLILNNIPTEKLKSEISKLNTKEELKLVLDNPIDYPILDIMEISELIHVYEIKVITHSLKELNTKGFIFLVICSTGKRFMPSYCNVKFNEESEIMEFGIDHVANRINECIGSYRKAQFINDYNSGALLDHNKLKRMKVINDNMYSDENSKEKSPKRSRRAKVVAKFDNTETKQPVLEYKIAPESKELTEVSVIETSNINDSKNTSEQSPNDSKNKDNLNNINL